MNNHTAPKIITHYDPKPIPDRSFDWSAVYDDYDCDWNQYGYVSQSPVGYGKTEEEAIRDLMITAEVE